MPKNKRLRAARVLREMTQLELAGRVGLKEIEISRLETGRMKPDTELKARIAEVLRKPVFEIFDF